MVGSNLRGPVTDNGNHNSEEISWEVRPGGMVVQTREDDVQEPQGFDSSSLMIKVSHGSNLHNITVPSTSTFGDVKKIIAQEIGVDPETQKLFFRGKEKEDYDYLQMAGIKDNAKLLLVEDTRAKEISSKEMNETIEVSRGSEAIAEIRAEVDKLAEKVSALQGASSGTKIDEKDIVYITEMLMRQLLELDKVEAAGEGKIQRKMEVRRIQRLVEEMDILKARKSNPFSEYDNSVSVVTTKWENFDTGVGSLTPPNPAPPTTSSTQEWEQFD